LPAASSVYLSPSSNRSSSNIIHEETHRGAREKNLERATAFVSAEIWGLAKNLHWVSSWRRRRKWALLANSSRRLWAEVGEEEERDPIPRKLGPTRRSPSPRLRNAHISPTKTIL
jgi:hypothetical protein